jgi:hypothetical protein
VLLSQCSKNRRGAEAFAAFVSIAQTAHEKVGTDRDPSLPVSLFADYSSRRPLTNYLATLSGSTPAKNVAETMLLGRFYDALRFT